MTIQLHIAECKVINDGSSFADYIYKIFEYIDGVESEIERSYLDFCDLDAHIRTEMHTKGFPEFPLLGANAIRKLKSRSSDPFGALRRATIGGDSAIASKDYVPLYADDRNSYIISSFDVEEDVRAKTEELAFWINHVLSDPAALELIAMTKFLNKEEKSFRKNSEGIEKELSEYDFLVPRKSVKSKQLISKFTIPIEVQSGDILVWRFQSKSNDVAYSIEINGTDVLPSRRYASSKEEVLGMMQVPAVPNGQTSRAICEMKFENKYAGMMLAGTSLSYSCRVVESLELTDSRRRTQDANAVVRQKVQQFTYIRETLMAAARALRAQSLHEDPRAEDSHSEDRAHTSGSVLQNALAAGSRGAGAGSLTTSSVESKHETAVLKAEIISLKKDLVGTKREMEALRLQNTMLRERLKCLGDSKEDEDVGDVTISNYTDAAADTGAEEGGIGLVFDDGDDTSSGEGEPSGPAAGCVGDKSPLLRLSQKVTSSIVRRSSPAIADSSSRIFPSSENIEPKTSEADFDTWYVQQFGETIKRSEEGNSRAIQQGLLTFAKRVSTIFKSPVGEGSVSDKTGSVGEGASTEDGQSESSSSAAEGDELASKSYVACEALATNTSPRGREDIADLKTGYSHCAIIEASSDTSAERHDSLDMTSIPDDSCVCHPRVGATRLSSTQPHEDNSTFDLVESHHVVAGMNQQLEVDKCDGEAGDCERDSYGSSASRRRSRASSHDDTERHESETLQRMQALRIRILQIMASSHSPTAISSEYCEENSGGTCAYLPTGTGVERITVNRVFDFIYTVAVDKTDGRGTAAPVESPEVETCVDSTTNGAENSEASGTPDSEREREVVVTRNHRVDSEVDSDDELSD